jgi:hypothetical protein
MEYNQPYGGIFRMANNEQLAILEQGAEVWNEWRHDNPDVLIDLEGAVLRHKHLEGINLSQANMENANLSFANLKKANLAFCRLKNTILSFATLDGANLSAAYLEETYLEDASLEGAVMAGANFKKTIMTNSNLKNTYLVDANFEGTNLIAVNFANANLSSVTFDQKILGKSVKKAGFRLSNIWRQRYDLLLDTTIRCKGVNATTCYGSQRFKLFLQDQDFLEEYLETAWGKKIFFIWWLFADCGRSLSRWALWSLIFAMIFTIIFLALGPRAFNTQHLDFNLLTLFYYSVVTFTTLGFGDIIPKTSTAAMWVTLEVIFGYIMLGGLITIFASKLSRRGG